MTRRIAAVLAVGYALSFLVLCLGTCLFVPAGRTDSAHACCAKPAKDAPKTAITAVGVDCCAATEGTAASKSAPAGAHVAAQFSGLAHQFDMAPLPARTASAPDRLDTSPPLVLRI